MATTVEPMTEVAMKLKLTKQTSEKLSQRAAASGKDVAAVASDLLEQVISQPPVDELLAPFRKQVAESGLSDEQLDDFFGGELEALRLEKKAKSA